MHVQLGRRDFHHRPRRDDGDGPVNESDLPPMQTDLRTQGFWKSLGSDGVCVLRNVIDPAFTTRWLQAADAVYSAIGGAKRRGDGTLPATVKSYRPTASSMLLESIATVAEIRGFIAPLRDALRQRLGATVVWNADQAWLRRQFPRHLAPPLHHPHGWHQDGALGFDFAAHPEGGGPESVLRMLTAWVPLTCCGRDAPGLEWIAVRPNRLLGIGELADERLRSTPISRRALAPGLMCELPEPRAGAWRLIPTFADELFVVPELRPADAVLMWGDVLHRTHVTETMRQTRTSVEFRFHSADDIPARLTGQRFFDCW
jgi:hypothetical protein